MPLRNPELLAYPLRTGQTTVYAIRDDADLLKGLAKAYSVLSSGSQSGTTAIYVPTVARNDIAFTTVGGNKITAAAGLDVVKTNDVIRIRGSTSNETEYTVTTGNVATEIVLSSAPTIEAAGAWITIAKQALQSNNCVDDLLTNLKWLRYGSYSPVKLGAASDGKLLWTATLATVHPAGADLQMIGGTKGQATLRIVGGSGESLRYHAGYSYDLGGFANAVNNLPGFRCVSVTVNGADLDIVLDTGDQTCISEAAAGARTIDLMLNDIWSFCNNARAASVGGYSDWRVANLFELINLAGCGTNKFVPDATAFPSMFTDDVIWSATTNITTAGAMGVIWGNAYRVIEYQLKTVANMAMLVRGGV